MKQGEPGDCMYILIHGRLHVVVERDEGAENVVGEVGRGETVGEMAILIGTPRSATVRAIRDSQLVRFSKEAFTRLVERHPGLMHRIVRLLGTRLRQTVQSRGSFTNPVTFAVMAAGSGAPLSEFSRSFAEALSRIGPTLHLSGSHFDNVWGRGKAQTPLKAAGGLEMSDWLSEQEEKYQFVVYEAEAVDVETVASNWTNRCIRQADRLVFVGDASGDPSLNLIERRMMLPWSRKAGIRRELVLMYSNDRQPGATGRWLAKRHVEMHHHVRWHSGKDFERLARILTGRGIGLVLGGGGVRGFAHIGVIRALEDKGVPIDFVGGTSAGAIAGAQYALGWDSQTMFEVTKHAWLYQKPLTDLTIPTIAFISGRKTRKSLIHMFGDTHIEDLRVGYFCMSSDLTTAEQVIHQRGPLWRGIRASCSLPGLVVPVFENGHMLVDGGILNNLPGDVMRQLCGGYVVAVDVSPRRDGAFESWYEGVPSGWQVFWSRMNPFRESITSVSMMGLILRTAMLNSVSNMNRMKSSVDLYLHPPLDQFHLLDMHSFEKIVDIGYEYACKAIEESNLI
jgi:predicted acylesterase/phospholipase RssA